MIVGAGGRLWGTIALLSGKGILNQKRLPLPSTLSSCNSPPIILTSLLLMGKPKPVPSW
ncbi:hypothetical protein THIOM_001131 [Candidatus Thiomargarita nelsonii]|uniref:Uncharacterized protein n=1 Tax=Candidatus Thiomargarita nelsonii TaxID=1003181 RepID=A0A176S4J8_9GAMM|nr:hypothetical protein THIOM_001131 [Candidatus Thiomargarita nelsonii]